LSRPQVNPRYPRQINFQVTEEMAAALDGIWYRSAGTLSRAEVIRQCIDEALPVVALRMKTSARVRKARQR
jgi:hypothetical protein